MLSDRHADLRHEVRRKTVATAHLYVDGHMKAYTGKRKLAEVWTSSGGCRCPRCTATSSVTSTARRC
jgi:hypothetical protein